MIKNIIAMLLLFVYGCDTCDKTITTYSSFSNEIDIQGYRLMHGDSLFCENPSKLFVEDNSLFIVDRGRNNMKVCEYSIPDLKKRAEYGRVGRAKGEYISLSNAFIDSMGRLVIFDGLTKKCIRYNYKNKNVNFESEQSVNTGEHPFSAYIELPNGEYAIQSLWSESQIFVYNKSGENINRIFNAPLENQYVGLFQMKLDYCANNNIVVGGSVLGELLSIYNFNDEKSICVCGPDGMPQYNDNTGSLGKMLGFIDVVIYGNSIYALYSGQSMDDTSSDYAPQIRKYNLQGEPLIKYNIDINISKIFIYKNKIYGYDLSSYHPIVEFFSITL